MSLLVNMVAAQAMSAAEMRLTGHAVQRAQIVMVFPLFCTWYKGQPPYIMISPLWVAKKKKSLWEKQKHWFSHVFNTVHTSCQTNKVKPKETATWFGKLPGVGDRKMESSPGSTPNL